MNQKNGKRKVIFGIVGAIVTVAGVTAAVIVKKPSEALKESSEVLKPVPKQALVRGMIGHTWVHFWINDVTSVPSEMILMTKVKAPGDTVLQVADSSYAPKAYVDSTIVSFQLVTDVEIAQQ